MIATSDAVAPDERPNGSPAFARVLAYGRKVARDLALTGVPEDSYAVQEARQPPRKEQFGFYAFGDDIRVPVRERRLSLGGWRVHHRLLDETIRLDEVGSQVGPATSRTVREIWLLRTGALQEAMLHTEADGVTTAQSTPLTEAVAASITDAEQWRQERSSHAGVRLIRRTAILTPSGADPELSALEEALDEVRERMNR
ncbi:MAG TPA: hypothetical protein H9815_00350 [Candidatus Ruania gallistercoris]|uniref:Uncharacterized protein n=1 Tax=Candidatus Ruania gallistercoris TaxID=2838746 RepID=A0A9D2EBD1_9MICO|nr:hypothetical protein [Candidatus Ruania gallistercoris]